MAGRKDYRGTLGSAAAFVVSQAAHNGTIWVLLWARLPRGSLDRYLRKL